MNEVYFTEVPLFLNCRQMSNSLCLQTGWNDCASARVEILSFYGAYENLPSCICQPHP